MIRVLQVFASLDRGGAESMMMSFYRQMDREKVQFDFVANESDHEYAYEAEIRSMGGRIFRVPKYSIGNHITCHYSWKRLLDEHPEWGIIHIHNTSTAFVYLGYIRKTGRYSIVHSHTANGTKTMKSALKRISRKIVARKADARFACGLEAGEWMYGGKQPFMLQHNAICIENFRYEQYRRDRMRTQLSLADNTVYGIVASFSDVKNHAFLIEVFRLICANYPKAVLLLVGSGELQQQIKETVISYGLEKQILFLGQRADVSDLLQALDVFLLPSKYEGLPVCLIEAQTAGLRCFTSDMVTREVNCTGLVEYIPLSLPKEAWAERITCALPVQDRASYADIVAKSGYDVRVESENLQNFYLRICAPAIKKKYQTK